MAEFSFPPTQNNGVFIVPNSVVDKYINEADETSVKVLLYLLRHGGGFTVGDICGALKISEQALTLAINYWVSVNVLSNEKDSITLHSTAINIHSKAVAMSFTQTPPEYDYDDIEKIIEQSKPLRSLMQSVQSKFSRTLSGQNMKTIYSFYDFYGFSPEVIFMLVSHCCDINKSNMKYIEQVAHQWYVDGINNEELAADYIRKYKERLGRHNMIRRIFGIGDRSFSTKEKSLIKKWTEVFMFGEDMILSAYERCVDSAGKLSFAYIDKILTVWFEKGFKTPADIVDDKPEKKEKKKPGRGKTGEATYDIEDFEKWSFQNMYSKEKGE